MLPLPEHLADDVVALRALRDGDAEDLVRGLDDPDVARFTLRVPTPYTREDAEEFLEAAVRRREEGEELDLACADPETGRLVGGVSLHAIDLLQRVAEVGCWTAPWARGRGVATHAVRLLSRWALTDLGLVRVVFEHDVDNAASGLVAARAGFVREGVRRDAVGAKGRRWTLASWSLLASDLERDPDGGGR